MYEYEIEKKNWKKIIYKNNDEKDIPAPRYKHSSVIYKDQMYIFGGLFYFNTGSCGTTLNIVNDMHRYSFEKQLWREVKQIGKIPNKTNKHTSHIFNNMLYLLGGEGNQFDIIYKFNFKNNNWSEIKIHGSIPTRRKCNTTVINKNGEGSLFINNKYVYLVDGQ
jgi:N-acetylneuraminic acid mutarotase